MVKLVTMADRTCRSCNLLLPASAFLFYSYITNQGKQSMRFESRCKACNRLRRMARYNDDVKGAMDRATSQKWKAENSDKLIDYRKRRQQDAAHKANKAKAQRIRKARMRADTKYHDTAIADIYRQAMDWEKKLEACIVCDDQLEMKMHVDHIVPLKLGGMHVASNLQVISAKENLKKGAKPHFAIDSEASPNG